MDILLISLIVGALIIVKYLMSSDRSAGSDTKKAPVYKYSRKNYIMTRAESEFFKLLSDVASDKYYVFPQVHLSALLDHKISGQNWKPAFRHINGKSVDFALCDKTTLQPMYAVELDDLTHDADDRRLRDVEVERIFAAANLPLVRFRNYKSLSKNDIIQRFADANTQATT